MSARARLRRGLLAVVALLYALSIPWYRSSEAPVGLVFGLPEWVAVALGCYFLAAILNAWAWLLSEVRDSEGPDS